MVRNNKAVATGDESGLPSGGTGRISFFSVISYFEYSCRMVYVNLFYIATQQSLTHVQSLTSSEGIVDS